MSERPGFDFRGRPTFDGPKRETCDHPECCRYFLCAHPKCCGYAVPNLSTAQQSP